MKIQSTRFGEIDVADEHLIKFSHGIPGFPGEQSFAFIPYQSESPFAFLQSVSDPDLTFVVVEPFHFFPDYNFQLDDSIATYELGFSAENTPWILNIVRIPEKAEEMTANLLAPIVINSEKRIGMQIVLEKSSYKVRHRLFPQGIPKQTAKGGR
jgi:flagellar assembly factor FliW